MAASPRFHIHTFGCKVNRAESERIAALLAGNGWVQAGADDCDVAIVNTCTVTGEADAKNRKEIRRLLRSGAAWVLVCGCAVNVDEDHYADIDERVVCESDKTLVPAKAASLLGMSLSASAPESRDGEDFRTRVDLKVQDGCDNACTFCIVHTARGPARSLPLDQVVRQVASFAEAGVRECVLVGINLGAYDSDGVRLDGLLDALLQRTSISRLRISSIEPQNLSDALVDVIARSEGRVCRHLHLCLQSGSTKVLREMHRPYDAESFTAQVRRLRERVPGIALSTDVIIGFPGETDEDFEATLRIVEECGFMRLHVFRYSKRPGTPAAAREDQVSAETSAQRAAALRELGKRLSAEDARARIGSAEDVVVERPHRGTSETYRSVRFEADLEPGLLVPMRFTGYDESGDQLIAEPFG